MHQNPPFSGKNSIFFWGGGTAPSPDPFPSTVSPHYEILDPPLCLIAPRHHVHTRTALCVIFWHLLSYFLVVICYFLL